jgi:hypothetical protein
MRFDDARLANIVTVTIASMEYDARLRRVEDPTGLRRLPAVQPFVVEVRAEDWQELAEVLSDLIDEQLEFDEYLERRDRMVGRSQRRLLLLMVVVVSALAAAGAIK